MSVFLLKCVISFTILNPDGIMEKRVYDRAIGTTASLNTQYLNVDFSKWQANNKLELPWTTRNVNVNNCLVIREYGHEANIPKDAFE